jgi:hypothetical protein
MLGFMGTSKRSHALVRRARAAHGTGTFDDTRIEVLSELSLDIDGRIAMALGNWLFSIVPRRRQRLTRPSHRWTRLA